MRDYLVGILDEFPCAIVDMLPPPRPAPIDVAIIPGRVSGPMVPYSGSQSHWPHDRVTRNAR